MKEPPLDAPEYLAGWVHDRLAEDPAYAELGIGVRVTPGRVVLFGIVASDERRLHIGEAVGRMAPGYEVRNELTVQNCQEPTQPERLS